MHLGRNLGRFGCQKGSKMCSKTDPKSNQNLAKSIQKLYQKHPKCGLGAISGRGRLKVGSRRLKSENSPLCWGAFGFHFGGQNLPQTDPRRLRNGSGFASYFRCNFSSILARFSLPTWLPNPTKMEEKSVPRCLHKLTSFWDRFLIDFDSQLGPICTPNWGKLMFSQFPKTKNTLL